MKLLRATKTSVQIFFLALALNACAGDDAATEESVEANGEENAAEVTEEGEENINENMNAENTGENPNANENFNNENVGNGNNLSANAGNNPAAANEFVNNAAGENFLNEGNGNIAAETAPTDPTNDLGATENSSDDLGIQPSDDIVGGNQNAAASPNANVASQPNANMGATDSSLTTPAAPTEAAPAAAPMTGGRVHYVMRSGTNGYDKPSGQVVKTYEQGDHPLVTADGEWARTSDGAYVSNSELTTKPVSRAKAPKTWR